MSDSSFIVGAANPQLTVRMSDKSFWIGVVSRAHVLLGVKGGFIQLNHGKRAPLQKLHAGDGFVFYSPKTSYPDGEPCQMFTAIGIVRTGDIYPAVICPENRDECQTDCRYKRPRSARQYRRQSAGCG